MKNDLNDLNDLIDLTEEIPEYKNWIDSVSEATFFGKKITDMSKKELIGLIGWIKEDNDRAVSDLKNEHKMFMDIEKSKPKTLIHDFINHVFPEKKGKAIFPQV